MIISPKTTHNQLGLFLEEEADATMLTAVGTGYILIISDQGNIMRWKVVYTPKLNENELSLDNYH